MSRDETSVMEEEESASARSLPRLQFVAAFVVVVVVLLVVLVSWSSSRTIRLPASSTSDDESLSG